MNKYVKQFLPRWIVTISYWLVTGLIPYLILKADFPDYYGDIQRKYHNLFLFPLIMGWLLPLLVWPALSFIWKKLVHLEKVILISALAFVAIGGTMWNSSEDYTVWEVKSQYLIETFITKEGLVSKMEDEAQPIPVDSVDASLSEVTLFDHFQNPLKTFTKLRFSSNHPNYSKTAIVVGEAFDSKIAGLVSDRSNYSVTRYAYSVSLFVHLVGFLSVFLTGGLLFRKVVLEQSDAEKKKYLKAILRISLSLLVIITWVYSRMGNQIYKLQIYGPEYELVQESVNIGILFLLFFLAVFIVGTLWLQIRETLTAVIAFVSSLGLGGLSYQVFLDASIINKVMNQPGILVVITFVIVLVGAIFSIPNRLPDQEANVAVPDKPVLGPADAAPDGSAPEQEPDPGPNG